MKKNLNQLSEKLQSLSNQLVVVEKTMSVYEKNLPGHKLTQIGKNAMEKASDEINAIKKFVGNMLVEKDDGEMFITNPQNQYANEEKILVDFVQSTSAYWQDHFNLKISITPYELKNKNIYFINLNEMCKVVENFLNCSSMAKSTLIEINFAATDDILAMNLSDNAEMNTEEAQKKLIELKDMAQSLSFECRINSMQGIGNGIIMRFPIKK